MQHKNGKLMSLLPITLYGDKILRKKAQKVKQVDIKTIELIKNMFETMRNASGIGLAANQIGIDKQIFVIDISQVEGYEKTKPMVFINPEIVEYSKEKDFFEEGCLSIPDVRADVLRPQQIKIKYCDTDLNEHIIEADDLLARVAQHEYDHLLGILFTDYVEETEKGNLKNNLHAIRKRSVEFTYPVSENIDYILRL